MLATPVELSTSPTIRIVSHGPQSVALYRVTIEIGNRSADCTLRAGAPAAALWMYTRPDGTLHTTRTPANEGTVWATFDDSESRSVLRRVKLAWTVNPVTQATESPTAPAFQTGIDIPPGATVAVDLDFDIPAQGIPSSITLHTEGWDIGCGTQLTSTTRLPLEGRAVLTRLRELYVAPGAAAR